MRRKIVAAGHICLDITPAIPGEAGRSIREYLSPGSLLNVGAADIHTGGSVANTGLAMRLLGEDVHLAGKIGDDAFGKLVQGIVAGTGTAEDAGGKPEQDSATGAAAADGLICRAGETTSYSVVFAPPGIDRIFLHHTGANDTFCSDDVSDDLLEGAALFHFGYPPLMRKMYENDGAELAKLLGRAKAAGAATSLDLALMSEDSDAGRADWERILSRVLPLTDIFVPSAEELFYMLDRLRWRELKASAVASGSNADFTDALDVGRDIIPLAARCLRMGVKILLIKCGASGLYYSAGDEETLRCIGNAAARFPLDASAWANRSGFVPSFIPERILSGTGAGDTCVAAFLTAILRGYEPEMSAKLAAAEGASVLASYDALGGLKSLEELEQKILAGWKRR